MVGGDVPHVPAASAGRPPGRRLGDCQRHPPPVPVAQAPDAGSDPQAGREVAAVPVGGVLVSVEEPGQRAVRRAAGCVLEPDPVILVVSACLLGGRSTVGLRALDADIGVRIPASQPIFRNIPSSSTAASCGVRFSLLRTCASRTRAHVSSQPPRFQRLGKSQASSNPTQVARVLKQSASGFGGTTGPSTEPTFNRPVFLSYEIIYKGRR